MAFWPPETFAGSITAMAQKIVTQLVDDIDGTTLDNGLGGTVEFMLDGNDYEIDLCNDHASQLRATLETYLAAGRRSSRSKIRPRAGAGTGSRSHPPASEIRERARTRGIDVRDCCTNR